ncbi:hypothetical protein BDZ97DRAFT_692396 [Flammula alnicola]|nr:hypothetical protein BDZ97DRAFT_692396 [Flammula alnicola]
MYHLLIAISHLATQPISIIYRHLLGSLHNLSSFLSSFLLSLTSLPDDITIACFARISSHVLYRSIFLPQVLHLHYCIYHIFLSFHLHSTLSYSIYNTKLVLL